MTHARLPHPCRQARAALGADAAQVAKSAGLKQAQLESMLDTDKDLGYDKVHKRLLYACEGLAVDPKAEAAQGHVHRRALRQSVTDPGAAAAAAAAARAAALPCTLPLQLLLAGAEMEQPGRSARSARSSWAREPDTAAAQPAAEKLLQEWCLTGTPHPSPPAPLPPLQARATRPSLWPSSCTAALGPSRSWCWTSLVGLERSGGGVPASRYPGAVSHALCLTGPRPLAPAGKASPPWPCGPSFLACLPPPAAIARGLPPPAANTPLQCSSLQVTLPTARLGTQLDWWSPRRTTLVRSRLKAPNCSRLVLLLLQLHALSLTGPLPHVPYTVAPVPARPTRLPHPPPARRWQPCRLLRCRADQHRQHLAPCGGRLCRL